MRCPNHVFHRPYHLTSLETPLSVARAVIYAEPDTAPRTRPTVEVVTVAKKDLDADEKLGDIGGPDYYATVYPVPEAEGMLPLDLAAEARTTRPVEKGNAIYRVGVELAEDSFVVDLRQLQDATLKE